ncbi:MAG: DegQ family serine endoprotease [Gammaproteobacteria bacterium]|nr:MAG: DegQ family serine endoprotease [Gammaproteobacteria bacterium]
MTIERGSFRLGVLAGIVLLSGVILGVVLSVRWDWLPQAQSTPALAVAETAAAVPVTGGPPNHFVPIVRAASPAVVNISTSRTIKQKEVRSPFQDDPFFKHFFGEEFSRRFRDRNPRKRYESSLGSGVIVDRRGYIITNNHVIEKADEIKVVLSDDREFEGKIIGTDPKTDLAVIKIEDGDDLPVIPWGNSDILNVGEYVLAIGNPFGLSQTITMGIVSAVGRANVGIADYEDFIQTDAAINPGNSGGALVNTKGELVGINTAIFSRSGGYMGIGFAVPSNMAKAVMDSLIKTGKVVRGWLGVSIQKITKDLAQQFDLKEAEGALVSETVEGGPAEKAGFKDGDVIIEFDGNDIDNPTTLRNVVARAAVGKQVKVKVIRSGKTKTLRVRIAEQPKDLFASRDEKDSDGTGSEEAVLAGLEVQTLTSEIARQVGVPEATKGVVVSAVEAGSAAQRAGMRRGDVITSINRKRITSVKGFRNATKSLKKGNNILIKIRRRNGKFFIVIKP